MTGVTRGVLSCRQHNGLLDSRILVDNILRLDKNSNDTYYVIADHDKIIVKIMMNMTVMMTLMIMKKFCVLYIF